MIMFKGINTPKDVSNVTNPLMSVVHLDYMALTRLKDKTSPLLLSLSITLLLFAFFPFVFTLMPANDDPIRHSTQQV